LQIVFFRQGVRMLAGYFVASGVATFVFAKKGKINPKP
jgi:hypothetical protein